MVANGCFLDEAFGEIKTQVSTKEKKRKKKEENIELDVNYNKYSKNVSGYNDENTDFFEVEPPKQMNRNDKKNENESNNDIPERISEYRKVLEDKNYQNYLNYQRNRANHINNQKIEGFSNINDNFNDVLLFGLLGIFFLIFTDYIYKLGKKSY